MDAVAGLLDGPRAREAFVLRLSMAPPWGIRVEDRAPVTLLAVLTGSAWVVPDEGEAVEIGAGDVALARGPDAYLVADEPSTPPQIFVAPGDACSTLSGEPAEERLGLGVRTLGNSPDGPDGILVGTYHTDGEVSRRLLRALPALLVLRAEEWEDPLLPLLADELVKDEPGQEAVLDRLLDLLLIAVLRAWFTRPDARAPDWYRAYSDPVVGRALRLLERNPEHPWTVAELAGEVGISRAGLARQFRELVGEPPISFLTGWRISLAADLLLEPGATIESVAHEVGYSSPFALSTAFKRLHGISPQRHRQRLLRPGSGALDLLGHAHR